MLEIFYIIRFAVLTLSKRSQPTSCTSHSVSLRVKLETSIRKLDLRCAASTIGSKQTFFFLLSSGKRSLCNLPRLTEGSTAHQEQHRHRQMVKLERKTAASFTASIKIIKDINLGVVLWLARLEDPQSWTR